MIELNNVYDTIRTIVSAITERQQLPEAKRAKTVASRLAESTSPSTEVQGNEEGLAYIKKTTPLETRISLSIGKITVSQSNEGTQQAVGRFYFKFGWCWWPCKFQILCLTKNKR